MIMDPESMPTVCFSLTVRDGAAALDFYQRAFGANETFRLPGPEGGVAHAEFSIGNTRIFLSEEHTDWQAFPLPEGAQAPCLFSILTHDCDASYARAIEAEASPIREPADEFWGMRSAVLRDPEGYRWSFGQVIEALSPEEVSRRAETLMGG